MRDDIPFLGTPAGCAVTGVIMAVAYVVIVVKAPSMRPGVTELMIASAFGLPIGLLVGRVWIAYLQRISELVPSRPILKWVGHLIYPMLPLGLQTEFRLVLIAAWVCGLAFIYLALAYLRPVLQGVSEPWTRLGGLTVWEDTATTFLPYFLVWLSVTMITGLRWYRSLDE